MNIDLAVLPSYDNYSIISKINLLWNCNIGYVL